MTKRLDYDEPLTSVMIDGDPDFREALHLINGLGVHTVSSCQGHAPGTQYDHVQEWMDPFITAEAPPSAMQRACDVLLASGAKVTTSPEQGKVHALYPREWDWKRSVAALKTRQFP